MKKFLEKIIKREDLSQREAKEAMEMIISNKVPPTQIGGFLIGLATKGESPKEIAGFVEVMRKYVRKITPKVKGTLVDVCGTGGDKFKTFNISTCAMFVVAGAGVYVAKHGNRAITSKCGSADLLEELGINLDLGLEKIKMAIEKVKIGFMFAPHHHPAMKNVMPYRRELGVRTVFNILGPLTNPAFAKAQLMGVFDKNLTEKLANVFKLLKLKRAMVVWGEPGLDEISNLGKTKITELKNGKIRTYYISPRDFGLKKGKMKDLLGGDKKENAKIFLDILTGKERGPKRDIVLLNSAGGILVGGKAKNLKMAFKIAQKVLDEKIALRKFEEFKKFCQS